MYIWSEKSRKNSLFILKSKNMPISKDLLEKFIQTILEIQNSKNSVIHDTKDLKSIAVEMGYTENDWQEYIELFEKYLNSARAFLEHNNTNDAILNVEKAVELNPYSLEANALASQVYKYHFLKTRQKIFKQKAIAQANKCLHIDNSHSQSYELISFLKNEKAGNPKKIIIAVAGAILVTAIASVMLFVTRTSNDVYTENSSQNEQYIEKSTLELPEIPAIFVENDLSEGIIFEKELAELKNYDNSYSFKLLAYLSLEGIEISQLKLKIDLISKSGKIISSEIIEPVRERQAVYRPGDLIPVYFLAYENGKTRPDIEKVQISVYTKRSQTAALKYESSPEIKSGWAYSRPANLNFVFRERTRSINNSYKEGCYYTLSIEAENTGNTAVGTLKVEIEWYDFSEKVIISKTAYISSSSAPEIKRGQTRIYNGTWAIPVNAENIKGYKILISGAK